MAAIKILASNEARFGKNAGDQSKSITLDVFQRSCFARMWTLQEIVMAKDAEVHCRDRSISWDDFEKTVKQLRLFSVKHSSNYIFPSSVSNATDPKDKIFALYGIFQPIGINLPDPDYSQPIASIYENGTRSIISARVNLYALYLAAGPQRVERLPSWAICWDSKTSRIPLVVAVSHQMGYSTRPLILAEAKTSKNIHFLNALNPSISPQL